MRPERNNYTDFDEELVVLPEEVTMSSASGKTVLFKHDYYSSDNDYGRDLLFTFTRSMMSDPDLMSCAIFIDSAVKLLSGTYQDINEFLEFMTAGGKTIYVSEESMEQFSIDEHFGQGVQIVSDSMITEMLICHTPDIIIE